MGHGTWDRDQDMKGPGPGPGHEGTGTRTGTGIVASSENQMGIFILTKNAYLGVSILIGRKKYGKNPDSS